MFKPFIYVFLQFQNARIITKPPAIVLQAMSQNFHSYKFDVILTVHRR